MVQLIQLNKAILASALEILGALFYYQLTVDCINWSIGRRLVVGAMKKKKTILSLGGIAQGKKRGKWNEREYAKKKVSAKIAATGNDPLFLSDIEEIKRDFENAEFDNGKK